MSRTLDRSKNAESPRRWGEAIRTAMFQLTNDELVSFLRENPDEARRLQVSLKRAEKLGSASASRRR